MLEMSSVSEGERLERFVLLFHRKDLQRAEFALKLGAYSLVNIKARRMMGSSYK